MFFDQAVEHKQLDFKVNSDTYILLESNDQEYSTKKKQRVYMTFDEQLIEIRRC